MYVGISIVSNHQWTNDAHFFNHSVLTYEGQRNFPLQLSLKLGLRLFLECHHGTVAVRYW